MEFGKVPENEIAGIDFTLPPDGKQTQLTLSGKARPKPDFYVGCAKWGRKEWLGMIYPLKTKEADFLDHYVKHFNSIELNAMFYSVPKVDQVKKWKEKAGQNAMDGFLFFPKFPRLISHLKRLQNVEEVTDQFLAGVSEFGKFLGPCFLQLGENFTPAQLPVLEAYLKTLPEDFKVFVELRHKDWFGNPEVRAQTFSMLAQLNRGSVITDASGRRDCVHMELSTPEAFIRFVGNGQKYAASDFARVDAWVVRLKEWLDKGLEKVYFFLHQHDERDTPVLANYTIKVFNEQLGSKLAEVVFIPEQKGLF